MKKSFQFILALVTLGACSSREEINVTGATGDSVLQSVRIYKKDDSAILQNASLGTLPFFYGGVRGLNLSAIKWNAPVTSENPGVDCDLNFTEGKVTTHFFRCIAKEGTAHIIVSLQEDLIEGRRMLRRVFIDGKGEELVNQWSAAFERMGFRKSKEKIAGVQSRYESPKGDSIADVIWASSSNSATLRISPKF